MASRKYAIISSAALQHSVGAVGIVLEIPQHLSEIGGPVLQLNMIGDGTPSISAVTIAGSGFGEVGHHFHFAAGLHTVEQSFDDLLNVRFQMLHPSGSEGG